MTVMLSFQLKLMHLLLPQATPPPSSQGSSSQQSVLLLIRHRPNTKQPELSTYSGPCYLKHRGGGEEVKRGRGEGKKRKQQGKEKGERSGAIGKGGAGGERESTPTLRTLKGTQTWAAVAADWLEFCQIAKL
ncbi:hypothetical protein EYF80_010568 [Liparis tanakae]|uniref:Uncharacterized protein n=1 Tax=Liparis tanakae TaxID=230148 RepID=A0A4Z2IQ90_9TELE|nr:hypothetical protein EYF80_010568 [Liparis tanakae]